MKTKTKTIAAPSRVVESKSSITQDLIASRAYEKWQQRGAPLWDDEQDWFEAQNELEAEALNGAGTRGHGHMV